MPVIAALLLALAAADPWDEVAATAEMDVAKVRELLAGVEVDPTVLERMAKPAEGKPWHQYAPIFADDARYQAGLAFWGSRQLTLAAAEARTGVPASIIVAILGVETRYGTVMGNDAVVRSLFTLGFHHEKRGEFFRSELGHYLRLATDEGWELGSRNGSYAGAMGMGQFMPSSYRNYAVDGDEDGKRDLFTNAADAIHSVANYFLVHGWLSGEPALLPVKGDPAVVASLVTPGIELDKTWSELAGRGLSVTPAPSSDAKAKVLAYELANGPEYRVALQNFWVITRYNRSPLYARAVVELAARLEAGRATADQQALEP